MVERSLILEELQARVAELERLLEVRSAELRALQRLLDHRDLLILTRLSLGRPPLEGLAYSPELWEETTNLRRLEVGTALDDLWLARPTGPVPEPVVRAPRQPVPSPGPELRVGDPSGWDESNTLDSATVAETFGAVWADREESER
jgi:hypothetical protein